MKILGIGNAIVDVICKVDDNFIVQNNLTKGLMKLVFDELKHFKEKHKVEYNYFWADTFLGMSRKELDEFVEMYAEINLPFWMQTRPETIDDDNMKKLKNVGLHRISFGVEHGNEEFRKRILDRRWKNKDIIGKLKIPKKYGIQFSVNNITGFPTETKKLAFDTIELNRQIDADNHNIYEVLELLQKDVKTLEKAVYSGTIKFENGNSSANNPLNENSEDVLTRHLLKLSEIENQFQQLTNKFEEINFKLDKLSNRLSKVQADNQVRFQNLETSSLSGSGENLKQITKKPNEQEVLPGSSQPQDLGSISYKDSTSKDETQQTQSIDTTATIITETFQAEEKILPDTSPKEQYEFATSFLKVGDYSTAERAFREFVDVNPDHKLAGNAQYWYAETFRIRQLYTDAASAYLEGYQKYPKGEKAPINLLKLGVSMVQIGEKDQGCKMINGVEKQYPEANQSVIQKAKYESQKFECKNQNS